MFYIHHAKAMLLYLCTVLLQINESCMFVYPAFEHKHLLFPIEW